jgi:lactoylglutathione lyase
MAVSSNSSFAARVTRWRSSTLAINSLPCRRDGIKVPMMVATSVSSSMTRRQPARALHAAGIALIDGHFLDFRDPWGNRIEIVGYDNIQFTKAPNVLRGMGLSHLTKNDSAKKELAEKGMALNRDGSS